MAVATGGGAVYVAGMVTGSFGTPLPGTTPGGVDGFLARFTTAGAASWTKQIGTTADEQLWGVAADASGNATVAGFTSGDLFATQQGDKDIVVATFDPAGTMTLHDQLGTIGNDKGASVAARRHRQHVRLRLQRRQPRDEHRQLRRGAGQVRPRPDALWARQFGTTESDGADPFAEGNVFLATKGNRDLGVRLHAGHHAHPDERRQRRRLPHVVRRPGHEPGLSTKAGRALRLALPAPSLAHRQVGRGTSYALTSTESKEGSR